MAGMKGMKGLIVAVLLGALVGGSVVGAVARSHEPDDALDLVVIGDSIPFAAFCPGCTGFVDLYAAHLESVTGRTVEVANRSRNDSAGIPQIRTQVAEDQALRQELASAEVVIVSVGYNNALPDASSGVGCGGDMGDTVESYVAWSLATTPECLKAGLDAWAADYDAIFSTITESRAGAPTLYVALNVHNGNKNHPEIQAADLPEATIDEWERWVTRVYDAWNTMLCDRATSDGFACVDVYHAFNGVTGEQPSGAWTVDGAHPSQEGNQLIADLIAEIDLGSIGAGSSS